MNDMEESEETLMTLSALFAAQLLRVLAPMQN